jgi:hypothetical protein
MTTYCKLVKFPQIAKDMLTTDRNIINLKTPTQWGSTLVSPECFSKDFNKWLGDTLNLTVELSEIFYLKPNAVYPIHTDGHNYPNQKAKLNFVIGGAGSKMCWYEPLHPENFEITKFDAAGKQAAYLHIKPNDARELHSAELTDFCIVDAGTFHTVKNANELRLAWNLILADRDTKQKMLLPDLQQRLSEYVVD